MGSHQGDPRYSRSATELAAYCHALAQKLGLTLAYDVTLDYVLSPDHDKNHYGLTISVTEPFTAILPFYYTREEVLGYATGETKATIQSKIREELETCVHDDLGESPVKGAR